MNNAPPIILDKGNPCSPLAVPASQTALLLLDFHCFIINSQPGCGASVVANAASLRKWAKAHSIPVLHCMIDLRATTDMRRKMAAKANAVRDKMMGGDPAAMQNRGEPEVIAATDDEYIFYRPPSHVSAMGSYGLKDFLAVHGIRSLLLAGFSSSGCVINTAKGAADMGLIVVALEDVCDDKDKEIHQLIMKRLLLGQAHIASKDDFIKAWSETEKNGVDFDMEALADGIAIGAKIAM